jgi:hypothetical protein
MAIPQKALFDSIEELNDFLDDTAGARVTHVEVQNIPSVIDGTKAVRVTYVVDPVDPEDVVAD